jgi:hypothetical protein
MNKHLQTKALCLFCSLINSSLKNKRQGDNMELIFSDCVKQTTTHDSQNAATGANVLEMNQINILSSKKI